MANSQEDRTQVSMTDHATLHAVCIARINTKTSSPTVVTHWLVNDDKHTTVLITVRKVGRCPQIFSSVTRQMRVVIFNF